MDQNLKHEILDWVKAIVSALAIVLIIKIFLFDMLSIDGISMQPTLHDKERVFVNIIEYKLGKPQHQDIIVFTPSIEKNAYYIKRVIGIPGDTVRISGGKVYVNDTELKEDYLSPGVNTTGNLTVKVPEDSVFVLGDNRNNSEDSRDPRLGTIPYNSIKGHALYRIFPFDKIRKL